MNKPFDWPNGVIKLRAIAFTAAASSGSSNASLAASGVMVKPVGAVVLVCTFTIARNFITPLGQSKGLFM